MNIQELNKELGNIDLYLLDQILKGRYNKDMKILDAGCGEGRNLTYFLNNGFDVYGMDPNPVAIKMLQMQWRKIEKERFINTTIEGALLAPAFFDAILCIAVLHFAHSYDHFQLMFKALVNMLKPEGTIFIRMTTDIGLENTGKALGNGRYELPDGSTRYLLTQPMLEGLLDKYQLEYLEPVKAVNVQQVRSMASIVLRKKI